MIKVKVTHKASGEVYWLRGTVWAAGDMGGEDRATKFATRESADAGFQLAMKFTKPRVFAKTYTAPEFVE